MLKKITAFIAALAMLVTATACSNTPQVKNQVLSLYYVDSYTFVKDAVDKFNNSNKYGKIEPKTFYTSQLPELGNKFQKELASGAGPDILVVPAATLPNLSQYMEAGAFADLTPVIQSDKAFKISDYNEEVMKYGTMGNSRYAVPVSFTVDAMVTTRDIVEKYGIRADPKTLSMKDLLALGESLEGKGKYIASFLPFLSINVLNESINVDKKTSELNTEKVVQALNDFNNLIPYFYPLEKMAAYPDMSLALRNEELLMVSTGLPGIDGLSRYYSAFTSEVDPVVLPIPSIGEEVKNAARPDLIVAVNKNCKDKKAAFEYIKLLLSVESQQGIIYGFPVSKAAYEKDKKDALAGIRTSGSGGVTQEATLQKLFNQVDSIIRNITVQNMDFSLFLSLYQEVDSIITEKTTPDNAAKDMQDKATAYFSEKVQLSQATPSPSAKTSTAPQENKKLTIQYMEFNSNIKNAIRIFSESRKDVQIEGNEFPNGSYDEYIAKFTTSVMAGEGPDIMVYNPNQFNSYIKTISTGVFADLEPIMQKDTTFGSLNLNKQAFDLGMFEGKRYFLPLRAETPFLVASDSILGKMGIKIDPNGWTVDDLSKIVTSKFTDNVNNSYFVNSGFTFDKLVKYSGVSFIDYNTKKTNFQSPEFIKLMKIYKDIHSAVMPTDVEEKAGYAPFLIKNSSVAMSVEEGLGSPEMLEMTNSIYTNVLGTDISLYSFPTISKDSASPLILSSVASINEKCVNKEAAFDFLEVLLSDDIQKAYDKYHQSNIAVGFPMNLNAFKSDMDAYSGTENVGNEITVSNGPDGNTAYTFKTVSIPNKLRERLEGLELKAVLDMDKEIYKIIDEGMMSYLDGSRTAEETAKDIDEKVNLFLNE